MTNYQVIFGNRCVGTQLRAAEARVHDNGKELTTFQLSWATCRKGDGDLRSAGRPEQSPEGCGEGSTNIGKGHGPDDCSGGPGEGALGGGPGT